MRMKGVHDTERSIRNLRARTSASADERILEDASAALARSMRKRSSQSRSGLWKRRTTAKSRWAVLAAAAAICAVVVFARWYLTEHKVMPSAYAELLEAVENSKAAEWVHLRGEVAGQELDGWVSFHPLRVFLRSNFLVANWDSATQRLTAYDPANRTIRTQDTAGTPWSIPAVFEGVNSFFDATMKQIERAKEEEGAEIAEEKQVVAGMRCTLFIISGEKGSENRIMVDPLGKRVIRVEMVGADGKLIGASDIDYPETGPADIYALGVPHDARVEDVTPPADFKDLESKSGGRAGGVRARLL